MDEEKEVPAIEETVQEPAEPENEVIVTIGEPAEEEQEDHQPAPAWVKEVRKQNKELKRELSEVKKKLNQSVVTPSEPVLGAKPTLESMGYDATKFEQELEAWHEKKRKADDAAAAKKADEEKQTEKWNGKLNFYNESKGNLGVSDFEDAEIVVLDLLNSVQQGIIVQGAKDPALLVYAIGKNESTAKELAAITDPVEFTYAVARLEGQLKVTSKKPSTAPETRISGNSRPSGATDSTLERLRAEAERTGDYSKISAYKRQKRG